MKDSISLNQFKKQYCDNLQPHPIKGQGVVIPVDGYADVSYIRYYLAQAIEIISESEQNDPEILNRNLYTIQYLARLIKGINLETESEGLDKLLLLIEPKE